MKIVASGEQEWGRCDRRYAICYETICTSIWLFQIYACTTFIKINTKLKIKGLTL